MSESTSDNQTRFNELSTSAKFDSNIRSSCLVSDLYSGFTGNSAFKFRSSVVGKSLAPTPSTRVTLQPSVQQVHAPVQSLQPRVQSAAHVSSFLSQLPTVQPQLPTAQSQMPAVQPHLPAVQPKLPTAQPQLTTTVKSRNTLQHNSSSVKSVGPLFSPSCCYSV